MRRLTETSLDDSTSSLSRYTNTSANASRSLTGYQPAKRRRVDGLNTRFDRMVKTASSMLSSRNSHPAASRKRTQSSSTSSASSHDVPKTPIDAYNDIHPGKLGKDFSVLKMKRPRLLPRGDSDGYPKHVATPREPRHPLPDWLADTFSCLEPGHPLRGLLFPSRIIANCKPNTPLAEASGVSHEGELFAFSPPDPDEHEAPDPAYRAIENVLPPVTHAEPIPSNLRLGAPASALPFSTPGCFASVQKSNADGIFQSPLVSQQVTSRATNTKHPPPLLSSHLRLDDAIEHPQIMDTFPNLAHYDDPPSDIHEHDVYMNHISRAPDGGGDNLNVYATPGPTFACSRPVYFDSPTEDPSPSDPLHPESYALDLNAIDFQWRPFLRSTPQERDSSRPSASSSPSPLGYAVPNLSGDQGGWNARFPVDQATYGTSREELPCLAEGEVAYLDTMQPSNVNTTKRAITNPIISCSSLTNGVLRSTPELEIVLSPLPRYAPLITASVRPRGGGENVYTSETIASPHGEDPVGSEAHGTRPSTPQRQLPVSPPSAPHKARSSQSYAMPQLPVRNMSRTLPWMIPHKFSQRVIAVENGVNSRLSHVSTHRDSHDSIESWSDTG